MLVIKQCPVVRPENVEQSEAVSNPDEEKKLKKVLKRIERRKRAKEKFREKQKLQREIVVKAAEERARKKSIKAKIVAVPENTHDEFIDSHIKEQESGKIERKNDKQDKVTIEGFTVLGGENFGKKEKVLLKRKRFLLSYLSLFILGEKSATQMAFKSFSYFCEFAKPTKQGFWYEMLR